jgi:hypothetical protein
MAPEATGIVAKQKPPMAAMLVRKCMWGTGADDSALFKAHDEGRYWWRRTAMLLYFYIIYYQHNEASVMNSISCGILDPCDEVGAALLSRVG